MGTQRTQLDGGSARLESYVEDALELEERGEEIDFEDLCADHPELADAVREALGQEKVIRSWASSSAVRDPLADRVLLDRYRVVARIGAGAMGAVYRGVDQELKRDVAIKVLQPHLFGEADAEARFLREAEALAALRHPHVVAVYDRGVTSDGLHFLVMELLSGFPLSAMLAALEERVESGGWDALYDVGWIEELLPGVELPERSFVRLCARWAADLAGGLATAHAAGIYHRDVKPSNVFIAEDGRALLLDFGIAARETDATLTRGDTTLGTPRYMAPEQAVGPARPGPQLDTYSLAATLYHLVAARPPFDGDVHQVLTALQREEPRAVGKLHPGLMIDLQAIIECGMARELGRRYANAGAFEGDLRAFLDNRPVTARRRGPVATLARRARRSRTVQLTALIAVVVAASVGVPAWIAERDRVRREEHGRITARLEPNLTLGRRPVIHDEAKRRDVSGQLDRAVTLAPDDVATRSLRAAFRLDHGDLLGAAEDLALIAEDVDTPYARALAARYAAVAGEEAEAADTVSAEGLPAPSAAADRYLAAYHSMRSRRFADFSEWAALFTTAIDLLAQDLDDSAARELWLVVRTELAGTMYMAKPVEARRLMREVRDDAFDYQRDYGETSRTGHIIALTLSVDERYEESAVAYEKLIALTPRNWNALQNLGISYRRIGELEKAQKVFERALLERPDAPKSLQELSAVMASLERFDDALAVAARIPETDPDVWRRHDAEAWAELERALFWTRQDELEQAASAAARALDSYRVLVELQRFTETMKMNMLLCRAIQSGDNEQYAIELLHVLPKTARRSAHLKSLVKRMPSAPSPEFIEALGYFFIALAEEEAPLGVDDR